MPDKAKITVDLTPLGNFLEIEVLAKSRRKIARAEQKIITVAEALGFGPQDFITQSYLELWQIKCQNQGLPLTDMVFPS